MDREKKRKICLLIIAFINFILIPSLVSCTWYTLVKDMLVNPLDIFGNLVGVWVLSFFFMLWVTATALDM